MNQDLWLSQVYQLISIKRLVIHFLSEQHKGHNYELRQLFPYVPINSFSCDAYVNLTLASYSSIFCIYSWILLINYERLIFIFSPVHISRSMSWQFNIWFVRRQVLLLYYNQCLSFNKGYEYVYFCKWSHEIYSVRVRKRKERDEENSSH